MTAVVDTRHKRPCRGFVAIFVTLFERWMPDPFVLAIGPTLATGLAALVLAPTAPRRSS